MLQLYHEQVLGSIKKWLALRWKYILNAKKGGLKRPPVNKATWMS